MKMFEVKDEQSYHLLYIWGSYSTQVRHFIAFCVFFVGRSLTFCASRSSLRPSGTICYRKEPISSFTALHAELVDILPRCK